MACETFAAAGFGQFMSQRASSKIHCPIENEGQKEAVLRGSALRHLAVDM
ncbi:hypothetical protein MKY66_26490 [Paenibacillus sp. FSL R5-0766]